MRFSHNVIDDCFDFVRAGQWFYLIENGAVAIEGSVFEQSAPRSLLKSWSLGHIPQTVSHGTGRQELTVSIDEVEMARFDELYGREGGDS